ncbi:sulfatase-like hydrolase/transferase [Roseovarius sp. EL26]|uniref:sulfatase-like hydrolase/transferase n=1 Tax=Roseovarius sp. EL26 TaxID=2126672 RepID=UPI000EA2A38F|nr:sulfatase-like hydrolase/transferase [Roseovarius sp. EL26]
MSFTAETIRKDNICVIWVDDMIDIFTWRNSFGIEIQTPNLDRFMARAARFTNAYATVPLCAPCRAELATGLSPFRTGLVDLNRFWRDVMPPVKAWQYDLRRNGFYNFTTGKVDSNYKPMPQEYSRILFHEQPQAADRGRRYKVKDYLDRGPGISGINHPDDDGSQDHKFYDFEVAQNAIDFLGRADPSRRTLIQLGFKHPHYNLVCPDRFYQMYDVQAIKWPSIAAPEDYFGPQAGMAVYEAAYIANGQWTPEKAGDEGWRQVVRAYFAAVSHVDYEIGRFLNALETSAFADNTTVIFLSDNGFSLGNHDSFHKMSQWDSAAHIPLGIWNSRMQAGQEVDLPVSLHNIPKTILDLAGIPPRPDWTTGQSLLPLIDESFGAFDTSKSPITCVFGTLSVRPSVEGYQHLRYFRYPNGEEHVYDIISDPGETTNLVESAPIEFLRDELVRGALELGLDLRGLQNPANGVNAMMAVDGTVVLEGGSGDNDYWAYGADAEKIKEEKDGGNDTLWYMAGPDDYVLHVPANIENIRIATVVARDEATATVGKELRIVAHPDSPINFETSERVTVNVTGSNGDDVMYGPKYAGAKFHGGAGNDQLIAKSKKKKSTHQFFGGAGDDYLYGGLGKDLLDGGTGNDTIFGNQGNNKIYGGHGNDVIIDGEGSSEVHSGPGHNQISLGSGNDLLYLGSGDNIVNPGEGAVKIFIPYGGVTRISHWNENHIYALVGWPKAPERKLKGDSTRLQSGISFIFISGVRSPEHLDEQIQMFDTMPKPRALIPPSKITDSAT